MNFPTDRASRAIVIAFAAIIIGLIAFLSLIAGYAKRQEAALAQRVLSRDVSASVGDLTWCLTTDGGDGLSLDKFWHGSADEPEGLKGYNHLTDIGVVIYDRRTFRTVAITTGRGRPLRPAEMAILEHCLKPSAIRAESLG